MERIYSQLGHFDLDPSGVWHYKCDTGATESLAADDALKHRPSAPCYFWFREIYVPMERDDTVRMLVERFNDWFEAFKRNPLDILVKRENYISGSN